MRDFARHCVTRGGEIKPLIVPAEHTNGLGLMNPSVYFDEYTGKLIGTIRQTNYTFYHSEHRLFQHPFGPLTYIHPENDVKLRTWNWYVEYNDDLEIERLAKVDTSKFPDQELWEFIGLEDARIFRWHNKLYLCGVRRDTETTGIGRMELCEIEVSDTSVKQVSNWRIPNPIDHNAYCEKNWVPIIDQPYHFLKWHNPTEIVKVMPNKSCTQVSVTGPWNELNAPRGGSQVIPWGDYYVSLTHDVDLTKHTNGRKNAIYVHQFIIFDKDWQLIKTSKPFNFMHGLVEFATGMCHYGDSVCITFGFQDNAAYILKTCKETIDEFING